MRSPITATPRHVHRSLAAGALTPHEAASRLVRLEFDVARLEKEISTSERRVAEAKRTLARHRADRATLMGIISRHHVT